MNNQKAVLYDTDWQKLRISTLAQYNDLGGWNTPEGTSSNISVFSQYLKEAPSAKEQLYRSWRILNMLNATRMGYSGQGKKDSEMDTMVRDFRDKEIQPVYQLLRDQGEQFDEWDWDKEAQRIAQLRKSDPDSLHKIRANLQNRHDTTMKRKQTVENRPELVKYLELLAG